MTKESTVPSSKKETTFWSRNKKLIVAVGAVILFLWIFAVVYTYYWLPRIYQMAQYSSANSPSPSMSNIPTAQKNTQNPVTNTTSWKTYTDNKNHFQFMYPGSWIQNGPLTPTDMTLVYLHSDEQIGGGIEPLQYFVLVTKETRLSVVTSKSLLHGYTVYKTDKLPSEEGSLSAFITTNGKTYINISITPYDATRPFPSQDKYVKIFNQILSSFKFTY